MPSPSKEGKKKSVITLAPFYPDVLFIEGLLESLPISNDEPTMQGDEPPQRLGFRATYGDITKLGNGI